MKTFAAIATLLLFTACTSVLPGKRSESVRMAEQISNTQQLTVERVLRPAGTNQTEHVRLTQSATQVAGADEIDKASRSVAWWVGVVACTICACLLMVVWLVWSKYSAAGAASDRAMGTLIEQIDTAAAHGGDAVRHALANLKAVAEKQRGKLAGRKR